jgi:hypothetical protein
LLAQYLASFPASPRTYIQVSVVLPFAQRTPGVVDVVNPPPMRMWDIHAVNISPFLIEFEELG